MCFKYISKIQIFRNFDIYPIVMSSGTYFFALHTCTYIFIEDENYITAHNFLHTNMKLIQNQLTIFFSKFKQSHRSKKKPIQQNTRWPTYSSSCIRLCIWPRTLGNGISFLASSVPKSTAKVRIANAKSKSSSSRFVRTHGTSETEKGRYFKIRILRLVSVSNSAHVCLEPSLWTCVAF